MIGSGVMCRAYMLQLDQMESGAAMWSGIFVAIGVGTFLSSFVQSGSFGVMGAKLARRVRELTFGALLRQVRSRPALCAATYCSCCARNWEGMLSLSASTCTAPSLLVSAFAPDISASTSPAGGCMV
jgi:hypothetical protein